MVPSLRRVGEPPPIYGDNSDEFTIELHHGGFFVGYGSNRAYVDEKVCCFDHCEADTWSTLWFNDFLEQLDYLKTTSMKIYWLLPGKDLSDGLRVVCSDDDTRVMMAVVKKVKKFVCYVDHDDSIAGMEWDDIVANPIVTLPKVLSPKKTEFCRNNPSEKLLEFYSNLKERIHDESEGGEGIDSGTEGSDSDYVQDFFDSDNEIEDDDDLFVDNVDEEVVDAGTAKGKKGRSMKGKGPLLEDDEELSTDEEDLLAPDSDGEGQLRMGFKSFRPEDLHNPTFRVGMIFESVELLREAITEYSLKHRVQLKMPRNEKKRLRAHCAEGCNWNLYASQDSRSNGLVVKTYNDQHNYQKH
ncbi:unnamed protein product [Urochloa humidicola]